MEIDKLQKLVLDFVRWRWGMNETDAWRITLASGTTPLFWDIMAVLPTVHPIATNKRKPLEPQPNCRMYLQLIPTALPTGFFYK